MRSEGQSLQQGCPFEISQKAIKFAAQLCGTPFPNSPAQPKRCMKGVHGSVSRGADNRYETCSTRRELDPPQVCRLDVLPIVQSARECALRCIAAWAASRSIGCRLVKMCSLTFAARGFQCEHEGDRRICRFERVSHGSAGASSFERGNVFAESAEPGICFPNTASNGILTTRSRSSGVSSARQHHHGKDP